MIKHVESMTIRLFALIETFEFLALMEFELALIKFERVTLTEMRIFAQMIAADNIDSVKPCFLLLMSLILQEFSDTMLQVK